MDQKTDIVRVTAAASEGSGAIGDATSSVTVSRPRMFRFGEPEPLLDRRDFLSYVESRWNGRWYEPPLPLAQLARTRHMSPHHSSALKYKVNQLVRLFEPTRFLDRRNFGAFALNFLSMGMGYLQRRDNLAGRPMRLENSPALYTRRGRDDRFFWVTDWNREQEFDRGSVFQLNEEDLIQEIYGIPEYLGALQSGLLNEASTIFRRRYYINGSHAGYILYINEEKFAEADSEELEDAVSNSKGPGNFRNVYLHIPGGKEKGVQVIPVGEAAAKDEFLGIKNTTRDDVLAAHRVPPVLLGVVPTNTGGFGDVAKAADVFHTAEIEPLQLRMLEVNDWAGVEAVRFRPYEKQGSADTVSRQDPAG